MNRTIRILILLIFTWGPLSWGGELSDEERLRGFYEHQRKNQESEKSRSVGSDEVKRKRQEWDLKILNSLGEFKASKNRQANPLDESSPEYLQDLRKRKAEDQQLEQFRQEYVKERDRKLAQKKSRVLLTEEEELDLKEKNDRVDWKKRTLYSGPKGSTRKSGMGSTNFGNSGSAPDFSPPPPPPPAPEFFEPEMPPPPPPPMPEFDEPIPPPIFDEPPPPEF